MSGWSLLVESSLRSLLIAGGVALVLAVMRVQVSRVRHAAWVMVLIAMLSLPALIAVMPPLPAPIALSAPEIVAVWMPRETEASLPEAAPLHAVPRQVQIEEITPGSVAPVSVTLPRRATTQQPFDWARLATAVYGAVAGWFFLQLLVGWFGARRLLRRSIAVFGDVHESHDVAAPVSVGILRQRIVLPCAWREWTEEQTNVVLAHERSHLARRDVLTAALAAINRSVFWFHPLAWWLERRIAATAEHIADDAALNVASSRQAYAQFLVDLAAAVQVRGARFSRHAAGMASGGRLSTRIDRVLNDPIARMSTTHRAIVASCCAAAMFVGIACQRQQPPAALTPDPEVTASIEAGRAATKFFQDTWNLSAAEIAGLEAQWQRQPGDLLLAKKLLLAYEPVHNGKWVPEAPSRVPARRALLLWVISNHPDDALARSWALTPRPGNNLPDAEGYEQARRLWLAHLDNPALSSRALSNAAAFFATLEPERTEQILLRAEKREPGGGSWTENRRYYSGAWTTELGGLYAEAIAVVARNELSAAPVALTASQLAFARHGRQMLDASQDSKMLRRAGDSLRRIVDVRGRLVSAGWSVSDSAPRGPRTFDTAALSRQYLERAASLDPTDGDLRRIMIEINAAANAPSTPRARADAAPAAVVDDLIAAKNFSSLSWFVAETYMRGESASYYKDYKGPAADVLWARTREIADRIIAVSAQVRDDANSGAAVAQAHQALGLVALREGNGQKAADELLRSADVPASDLLSFGIPILEGRLTSTLLKCGIYAPVAEYYDKMARLGVRADVNSASAAAIRAGRMPKSYQELLAREDEARIRDKSNVRER